MINAIDTSTSFYDCCLLSFCLFSQFEVLEETKSFFSYVISTLESLGKSLNKIKSNRSNQFDKKLFLYVIHCLAPSLTALFRRCEDIVLSPVNGVVKSRFSDVFSCVFSFVCNEYTVFIERYKTHCINVVPLSHSPIVILCLLLGSVCLKSA